MVGELFGQIHNEYLQAQLAGKTRDVNRVGFISSGKVDAKQFYMELLFEQKGRHQGVHPPLTAMAMVFFTETYLRCSWNKDPWPGWGR